LPGIAIDRTVIVVMAHPGQRGSVGEALALGRVPCEYTGVRGFYSATSKQNVGAAGPGGTG
jgi:hypothetical protein